MSRKSKIIYNKDLSVAENARINGVSIDGIYYYLKANNILLKQDALKGLIEEISKAIKDNPDMGQRGLAKITGHSLTTINKYYKAAKEALEKSGKRKSKVNPIELKQQIDTLVKVEHKNTERLSKHPMYYPIPTREDLFRKEFERYDVGKYVCMAFRREYDKWKDTLMPLGNMKGGYPFEVDGKVFAASENAYICGLFSNNTSRHRAIQEELQRGTNGYMAKKDIRKKNERYGRKDWEEFNIDWMMYVVWMKAIHNNDFRDLLLSLQPYAMLIEDVSFKNAPKEGVDKNVVWGCRNNDKKVFGELVNKYANTQTFKTEAAKKRFINQYLWDYCNYGVYEGQNILGKILTIIKDCLHKGTQPPIDYALLNSKKIYLMGNRIDFKQEKPTKVIAKKRVKHNRIYGIIGAVIGDMAGSRFEFREKELPNDKNRFSLICNSSLFTDDSVLTIAIADALLHDKPFADAIGEWGKRFMASGFSKRFIKWVKKGDWSVQDESTCDGCGMRISPIGFKGNSIEEVLEMAKNATIPTHNSEESIKAAQAIATSVFLARNGKSKEEIKQYVETHFNFNLDLTHDDIRKMVIADDPQDQKTKNRKMVEAKNAIPMAIIAFLNGNEYEDVLRTAIMYGGDTDTTCSMAGAIAAAYYGVPVELTEKAATNIPQEMLNIINEFDGTSLSIHRTTPPIVKNWSLDYVIVYGSDVNDKDGERGFSYTHASRHQPKPLKGFPIRTIGTTMDVIRKDVEMLIAKVNNEPQTTFVIENVGISKKTNIGVETMAQLFKPLIDKENVYFVKEYWDFYNTITIKS